jgi:hypothetical protein
LWIIVETQNIASLRTTNFSESEIEIPKSEIHYLVGAGGAGGAGGGAKCLAAQPVLKAKYIAASTIIVVIFFIAICLQ